MLKGITDRYIWKEKQNQKPTLVPQIQSTCINHTCGGYQPEGFIVVNSYNVKYIANNHDNNNKNNDTNNNKLSSCINFHLT